MQLPFSIKLFLLFTNLISSIFVLGQSNQLYVQTDKNNYVAGETIWLKSYINSSAVLENSNFYADLYNKSGKLIDSILLPVLEKTATGSLNIPSSLPEGIYFLNCYCKIGQQQRFAKKIFISNPFIKDDQVIKTKKPDSFIISPKYFVAGVQNTIYFKFPSQSDTGEMSGIVFNSKNEAVARIQTLYNQYGQFDLYPETEETYIVQLDFKDHQTFITLPKPKVKGVSIQTGNTSKGKALSILIPEGLRSNQTFTLQGSIGQSTIFERKFTAAQQIYTAGLDLDSIHSGTLNLTVKDKDGSILGEKAVFNNNASDYLDISLKIDTFNLTPQGYNSFSLVFPDSTYGSFSVSVVDEEQHNHSNGADIITSAYGMSGLSCYNIFPLFKEHSNANNAILDLLANFTIQDQIINSTIDSEYITIRGRVINRETKKLVTKGQLNFLIQTKDSSLLSSSATIAGDGSFILRDLVFFDTARFYYSLEGNPSKDIQIQLDTVNSNYYKKIPPLVFCANDELFFKDETLQTQITKTYKSLTKPVVSGNELREVTIKTKRINPKEQVNRNYTHGLFRNSNTSYVVDLINDPPAPSGENIFDFLQGRIPGLMITGTGTSYQLTSNRKLSIFYEPPIRLYLNEQETTADFMLIIPVQNIAMVKYFPPGTSSLPGVGISGVLAVYTKNPGDINFQPNAFSGSFAYNGYSISNQFENENSLGKNEYNSTVYWNPNVNIDENGHVFRFHFLNKYARRLHVIVEGLTADGKILHFEKVLE